MLIGLAVGVDYALFYLPRARGASRRGASGLAESPAAATSRKAILVSGLHVMGSRWKDMDIAANPLRILRTGRIIVSPSRLVGLAHRCSGAAGLARTGSRRDDPFLGTDVAAEARRLPRWGASSLASAAA